MQLIIERDTPALTSQTLITFVALVAALLSMSVLVGTTTNQNVSGSTLSFLDVDKQASIYQTWSDPLHDAEQSSDSTAIASAAQPAESSTANSFPFESHIRQVAHELQVDASLIYAVTKAESSFRASVQSHAGAIGLMQVIASAAGRDAYYRLHKKRATPTLEQLKDPYTNLQLGSTYLKLLEEHHFGHIRNENLKQMLVLAAYNWGPVNVKRKLLSKNPPRSTEEMSWVLWTKAPRETYLYVHKVLKYQTQFNQQNTLLASRG